MAVEGPSKAEVKRLILLHFQGINLKIIITDKLQGQ